MRAFCVTVAEADEDQAVAALWETGTAGIEVKPAPGGRLQLLAYFAEDAPAPSVHDLPPGAIVERAEVPDVDWVARFRMGFHVFQAGRFLIVPAWDPAASAALPDMRVSGGPVGPGAPSSPARDHPSRDTLIVDPGRAFGTGTHETTRLCLAALEGLAARRPLGRTLDLGAGTGLLAVAAERLGAAPVIASDVDPEATSSSRYHARLNRARLHVIQADGGRGFHPGSFDLVLANLMALLLADRAAEIRALLAPGGALVLSGLLVEDVPFVRRAFEGSAAARVAPGNAGPRSEPARPGASTAATMLAESPDSTPTGSDRVSHSPADPTGSDCMSNPPADVGTRCGDPAVIVEGEWAALVYEDRR